MERLNNEVSSSVFPKPDFSLIKNKKLEAQQKKTLALEKKRVDKVFDQFKTKFDSQSVAERIKQSEAQRALSTNETIEELYTLSPKDEQVAKTLEEIFNDWMDLLGRR
jgi:triphosphoribosyl-dephospho-CoA synthetase